MADNFRITITMPVRQTGLAADAADDTHQFVGGYDEPPRCLHCDSRAGSASASWACGTLVPRQAGVVLADGRRVYVPLGTREPTDPIDPNSEIEIVRALLPEASSTPIEA